MNKNIIKAIRGMHDILPDVIEKWQYVENKLKLLSEIYGFKEIRFPIIEDTSLFKRTIGESTDIINKEMYTFLDKNGANLSLRPEGTASCVRAIIENNLMRSNNTKKFWYCGPFFRYERPQRGRYRQFHQFAVEAFGSSSPTIDAEIILLSNNMWKSLSFDKNVELNINTIGKLEERRKFFKIIYEYLKEFEKELDKETITQLNTNPLRIFDSKNPALKNIIHNCPKLIDYLGNESLDHFNGLKEILDCYGLKYKINANLVRGLDYYSDTVFEWTTDKLGSQGSICGGGRYDSLSEYIGSKKIFSVGFAIGMERIINLFTELNIKDSIEKKVSIYIVDGTNNLYSALLLAEKIRESFPNIIVETNHDKNSFKRQFKNADKNKSDIAIILGEEELKKNCVGIKFLRKNIEQEGVSICNLMNYLKEIFKTY